ncbi:MAG: 3D domain-containing protein [Verrucomicrobiae bacterium]|nr:3D domain-containing protein [Verrucomicrobiae bacterium]
MEAPVLTVQVRRALVLWIWASIVLLCGVARGEEPRREAAKSRIFQARVTYYEPRSCPYGNVTSTGRYATEGVTVAVDPRVIPYGSRVRIAALDGLVGDGWFLAQDTGSAVKSRKASRRWGSRAPVVDVYVASASKLRRIERAAPMFCMVEVHQ